MVDSRYPKRRRKARMMAIALAAVLGPQLNALASPYDEVIFLGDSLTDTGAIAAKSFTGKNVLGPDGRSLPEYFMQGPGQAEAQKATDLIMGQINANRANVVDFAQQAVQDAILKAASSWLGGAMSWVGGPLNSAVSPQIPGLVDQAMVTGKPRILEALKTQVLPNYALYLAQPLSRAASTMTVADTAYILWGRPLLPAHTTNPDSTWAFHLARALGGGNADAWKPAGDGGNNYAWGGARTTQATQYLLPELDTGMGKVSLHYMIPSVKDQISALLQSRPGGLSRHGLYSVWVGANDLMATMETYQGSLAVPVTRADAARQVLAISGQTAVDVAGQVMRLRDAGAGTVLVVNLPDIGRTPRALGLPAQARSLLSYMASTFNDSLNSQLADYQGNLVALDVHGLLNEVIDHPQRYGLRNVTTPACGAEAAIWCGRANLVAPDADRTYLFADGIHPSGIGHALLSDYVLSVLQAPTRIGLLAEAPVAGTRASLSAIGDRLRVRDNTSGVQTYASYQRANDSQRGGDAWKPGFGNRMDMLLIGIDGGVGQNWLVGVGASQVQHHATLGRDAGWFRLGQTQLSAYGRYRTGDWSAALIGSVGYLSYGDVAREFAIGPARLREQGSTTGTTSALSASTQYDWHAGAFTLIPSLGLTWQNINVRGYNESRDGGRTATSMNYREQTRRSLASTLGLRLQADLRHGDYLWRPYAGLAWEHEFQRKTREVRGHLRGMAGSFGQTIAMAPADRMLVSAGLSVANGGAWSGQVGYQGRYGGGEQSRAVQASVQYRF